MPARSPGAAPADPGSSQVPAPPPEPPDWLAGDAREVWDRLSPLTAPGRLTAATSEAFAMLCVSLATYAEADELLRENSLLLFDGQTPYPHPALAIRDRQDATAARWLKTFGLTPDAEPARDPGPYRPPHLVET